jgi:hypothetical protein
VGPEGAAGDVDLVQPPLAGFQPRATIKPDTVVVTKAVVATTVMVRSVLGIGHIVACRTTPTAHPPYTIRESSHCSVRALWTIRGLAPLRQSRRCL